MQHPGQLTALRELDGTRLLLETDSPYFQPSGYRRSTPALLGMVAADVAKVLGIPWTTLLEQASANAVRLYVNRRPPAAVTDE